MRVRVASLNVWALPPPFGRDVSARMRAIGTRLGAAELDVLALQEVWTPGARAALAEAGRRAGLAHVRHAAAGRGGGLLLLSRWPLSETRFERFGFRGDPERLDEVMGGKGFLWSRVEAPGGPFALIDTHLHASYRRDRPLSDSAGHVAQLVQIADRLRAHAGPAVLAGDLNFEASHPEEAILAGLTGLRDAAVEGGRREPTIARANAYKRHRRDPDERPDRILLRDGAARGLGVRRARRIFDEPVRIGGRERSLSDHFGVWCELEITPSPVRAPGIPGPRAVADARRLLALSRLEARHSESLQARDCQLWLATAAGARLATHWRPLDRRRFLRGALSAGAAAALAPALGFGAFAYLDSPRQLRGIAEAESALSRLAATRG